MMEYENEEYQELDEFEEPGEPRRSFGGMSPVEMGILVVLIIAICVLVGFVGKSFFDNSRTVAETPTLLPTSTFALTVPANATSTPWPTIVSIPEWNKFEFVDSKASLWLPNSFQGGDPIAYPEIVMMTVETYSDDEVFIESVKNVLANNPDVTFFAFDADMTSWARVVVVTSEKIPPDVVLDLDGYINEYAAMSEADGDRVVGKELVFLDYFEAGRVIIEFQIPVGEEGAYTYGKVVIYLILVDDMLWTVAYRTGRDDFPDYWLIIKDSINTFHVQP